MFKLKKDPSVILASSSSIRAQILRNAGVSFTVVASTVDETVIQRGFAGTDHRLLATKLAFAKARDVSHSKTSQSRTDELVLGIDQILVHQSKRYDKPQNLDEARQHLHDLNGQTHVLTTAVCAFHNNACVWNYHEDVEVTFRTMTDEFMKCYIQANKADILSSLGCCLIEGAGAQLIKTVKGDYFTVLGLPLFAVLGFLRKQGVLSI